MHTPPGSECFRGVPGHFGAFLNVLGAFPGAEFKSSQLGFYNVGRYDYSAIEQPYNIKT